MTTSYYRQLAQILSKKLIFLNRKHSFHQRSELHTWNSLICSINLRVSGDITLLYELGNYLAKLEIFLSPPSLLPPFRFPLATYLIQVVTDSC